MSWAELGRLAGGDINPGITVDGVGEAIGRLAFGATVYLEYKDGGVILDSKIFEGRGGGGTVGSMGGRVESGSESSGLYGSSK